MLRRTCPQLCRRLNVQPRLHPKLALYRNASNARPPPKETKPWKKDGENDPDIPRADNFAPHVIFALNFIKRFVKLSLVGFVLVGAITATGLEAGHQWVEWLPMAPETDEEARKWGWDQEMEKWSGGDAGGTDPGLGFVGRHATRAAWITQNWNADVPSAVISLSGDGRSGPGGLSVVGEDLQQAHAFLRVALKAAEERKRMGKLHPLTISELLIRDAEVLEKMGDQKALSESRSQLQHVWDGRPPQSMAARVALKIGDLSARLGDSQEALSWWSRTMNIALNLGMDDVVATPPIVPDTAPQSPSSQRILVSTLVSLSAFYSRSSQLAQARQVQEASLSLIRSIPRPTTAASPAALHALYLLHRSSLLSIHLAEVNFALRSPASTCFELLHAAATSSELVALALTGLPSIHPDAPASQIPHPPSAEAPLLPMYALSRSMRRPASSLLRDAKRTAAEAWNLVGVLTEDENPGKALECYERALGWVGVKTDWPGGIGQPGEGVVEGDWKQLWANYVRARNLAKKRASKQRG